MRVSRRGAIVRGRTRPRHSELGLELFQDELRENESGGGVRRAASEERADGPPATLLVAGGELHGDRSGSARLVREPGSVRGRGRPAVGPEQLGSAPTARSSSTRASAERWCTSSPAPRPSPMSIAMTRPSIGPREASSSSRSRTSARDGAASSGRIRRRTDNVCGPTIPSGSSPDVPLEHAEGAVRPWTVEAVLLPAVEAERVQHPLDLAHVVSPEHRRAVIQRAIAELPAGLDELFPRVRADEAVHLQMSLVLEPPNGGLGRGSEHPDELRDRRWRRRAPSTSTGCPRSRDRCRPRERCASSRVCGDAPSRRQPARAEAVWGCGPTPDAGRGRGGSRPSAWRP